MFKSETTAPEISPTLAHLRRLGRNQGRYAGETIDIASVLDDCLNAAREHGWRSEFLEAAPDRRLIALSRSPSEKTAQPMRVYLSTGIHGDEPAGPLAAKRLLSENRWEPRLELFFCPCVNPTGFALGRRENSEGIDLNRQYRAPEAVEVRAHTEWLLRMPPFDLTLLLHEDWESHGFYVYELNPDNRPSLAEAIVRRVSRVCHIDRSEVIEGRPARDGIIRPSAALDSRPDWPEAFFLRAHKTPLSYTLEAPSDYPLPVRVDALCEGVWGALDVLPMSWDARAGLSRPGPTP